MKLRLRQILAIAVVSIVLIAMGSLAMVYNRVIDLRDSQTELIIVLERTGETAVLLEEGRSQLQAGGVLQDTWWRQVKNMMLPYDCCLLELQQLSALDAPQVQSTQVLHQIDVFLKRGKKSYGN